MLLVDFALEQPIFTVTQVKCRLGVTFAQANGLVRQLVDAGALRQYGDTADDREPRRTRGARALRMMCAFSPLPAGRCERLLTCACAPGDRAATPA